MLSISQAYLSQEISDSAYRLQIDIINEIFISLFCIWNGFVLGFSLMQINLILIHLGVFTWIFMRFVCVCVCLCTYPFYLYLHFGVVLRTQEAFRRNNAPITRNNEAS